MNNILSGAAFGCSLLFFAPANSEAAVNLISNGDFSAGFASWTTLNNGLANDTVVTFVPINPGTIGNDPVASNGISLGPATRVLYQDFTVPTVPITDAVFSFDFYSNNPDPLDSATVDNVVGGDFSGPNIFRIDIIDPVGDPFTNLSIFDLFEDGGGMVGSPDSLVAQGGVPNPSLAAFLDANQGNTLRLRIGNAESTFPWETSVDNISFVSTPEPSGTMLLLIGAMGCAQIRRRR